MNKEKYETNLLVKEIRDLISTRCFCIQLYENQGIIIEVAWVSGTNIDINYVYVQDFNKRTMKKCITSDQLTYKLNELKSRIGSICRLCDTVAKNRRVNKVEFFEDLLERAEYKCKQKK